MSIFGAIVRTTINIVSLPVTLPIAILQDITDPAVFGTGHDETKRLIEKIKEEAESDE